MNENHVTRGYALLKFCCKIAKKNNRQVYLTYTEFANIAANGNPRNHGKLLDTINQICHSKGEPLLGTLVVAKGTTLPIVTADWRPRNGMSPLIYKDLDIPAEQAKCWAYDWSE
jgi:hypothetical protein